MIPGPSSFLIKHALAAASLIVSGPAITYLPPPPTVPVLEVVKAYGSLASPTCYGLIATPGSSCQLPLSYLKEELGLTSSESASSSSLSLEEFTSRLNKLPFQWPLKPYGRDKSLSKTAIMNKGAETAVYMNELERRGLYDRRNPTGPLPSSLRSKLNAQLDQEGIDRSAANVVFHALTGGNDRMTGAVLDEVYRGRDVLDYYDFLDLIGTSSILWP